MQVRSSLFAAGCFCEVADDFALVVLGMLNDMVKFPELMPKTRLAAVRVFAKMGSSHAIANRAFKVLCLFLIPSASYAQRFSFAVCCQEFNFTVVTILRFQTVVDWSIYIFLIIKACQCTDYHSNT